MSDTLTQIVYSLADFGRAHGDDFSAWYWPQGQSVALKPGDRGIDVSEFQPAVDWAKVAASGIKFVFVKACEGTYTDPMFPSHWQGSKAVNLLRGAYLYFRVEVDPVVQAHLLVETAVGNELPLVVDVESQHGNPTQDFVAINLQICLREIESVAKAKPMIYTSWGMWASVVGNPSYIAQYPLWVAQYPFPGQPPSDAQLMTLKPKLPMGATAYQFWQYTDSGTVLGITNPKTGALIHVDLDLAN